MKLSSLKIKNFRALEDFEVKQLGVVNLIVGSNNSGKTSVLEALRIYAGKANRSLLHEISIGHDEKYTFRDSDLFSEDDFLPLEYFFTGRKFPSNDRESIKIGGVDGQGGVLELEHVFIRRVDEDVKDESGEIRTVRSRQIVSKDQFDLGIVSPDVDLSQAIKVSSDGTTLSYVPVYESDSSRRFPPSFSEVKGLFPCSFIPTQFISPDELAIGWDKVKLTDNEERVRNALQFIEEGFEDLNFVEDDSRSSDSRYGYVRRSQSLRRIAKVRIKGQKIPVPLNSMGDGMQRILQLALKVFAGKGGFLLIDEFENGLHWSIQKKVWSWLFDLAVDLNMQIFATTHSYDCVKSFSDVAKEKETIEAVLFRVGKSAKEKDRGRVIATEYDKDTLFEITQAHLDVR